MICLEQLSSCNIDIYLYWPSTILSLSSVQRNGKTFLLNGKCKKSWMPFLASYFSGNAACGAEGGDDNQHWLCLQSAEWNNQFCNCQEYKSTVTPSHPSVSHFTHKDQCHTSHGPVSHFTRTSVTLHTDQCHTSQGQYPSALQYPSVSIQAGFGGVSCGHPLEAIIPTTCISSL